MIEDTQIGGKMVPPQQNQQLHFATTNDNKSLRKSGGGNLHLDGDRNNKSSGFGYPNVSAKKCSKSFRQGQKRETAFTKNTNKNVLVDTKKSRRHGTDLPDQNNLYNLINFQYVPVTRPFISSPQLYYGDRKKRTTVFNKEAFLQANCHFIVDESKKYSVNAIDPDVLVDWEDIQLVYLPSHDAPLCPICLYPPVAGKITRCGHVFCWSCMLHYLKLGDKSWRKCPICHEAVHEKDLKSVASSIRKKYARLDQINMVLMKRSKDSLFAVPIEEWSAAVQSGFPTWKDNHVQSGYKLALSSKEKVLEKIFLREQTELEVHLNQATVDKTGEECFIQTALDLLKTKIDEVYQSLGQGISQRILVEDKAPDVHTKSIYGDEQYLANLISSTEIDVYEQSAFTDDDEDSTSLSPVACAPTDCEILTKECLEQRSESSTETDLRILRNTTHRLSELSTGSCDGISDCTGSVLDKPTKDLGSYYFYQAADGQNIFIHSLNARCLIEEYGSLADGPVKITGQIIDFECFTMTKELRKRFRYLSYLPLSCEFVIVELLLRPPVLSKLTIQNFIGEFKTRKDARMKKLDEQKKFDRRVAAVINKQEGYRPIYCDTDEEPIQLNLTDSIDFPQHFSPETPEQHILPNAPNTDGSPPTSLGPSFAQILSTHNASVPSKIHVMPAWGKEKLEEHTVPKQPNDGNESDEEPNLIAPSLKEMFSAAMFTSSLGVKTEASSKEEKNSGGNKKKKKGKGVLLFATGGQRKY